MQPVSKHSTAQTQTTVAALAAATPKNNAGTSAAGPSRPAAAGKDYGAAAASLRDPACQPGTSEFQAAAARNAKVMEDYRRRVQELVQQQKAKPDMTASSEVKKMWPAKICYGHVPGVAVGDAFLGRGELVVLGLHTLMMQGIMCWKGHQYGAYAIVLAGNYKDDKDDGKTFWYTGAGGQKSNKKGEQTEHQSYRHEHNAALVANCKTGTPVRVFRGKVGTNGERLYVYEGLYKVTDHKQVPSRDGPLVIQFRLEGIAGHSIVSSTVQFRCLTSAKFHKVLLAARAAQQQRPKKKVKPSEDTKPAQWNFHIPPREKIEADIKARAASGTARFGRLVTKDISRGLEKVPIPVWNAVDDDDTIRAVLNQDDSKKGGPAEQQMFEYISDYVYGEQDAMELADAAERYFVSKFPSTCGIQYNQGGSYYEDGLLVSTHASGVMECDPGCKCKPECKGNHVVLSGIRYPLEVFKARGKGWAVRCAVDVPVGAVLCCYIGSVIRDSTADYFHGQDAFLFDLNHFHELEEALQEEGQQERQLPDDVNVNMPRLPKDLLAHHLVVDASEAGNVARFINHSCDPNCLVQTVLAGNARSHLLHYIAIVAAEDIPAFTELTYNYFYMKHAAEATAVAADTRQSVDGVADSHAGKTSTESRVRIECKCGAENCTKWLLR